VAGKFYAFIKGDWHRGLVMLSLASDPALKSLAEKEMQAPSDTEEQVALADAWLAQAGKAKGLEADRQKARAAMWFGQVQGELTGLAKVEVQRKIDAIGKVDIDGGSPLDGASVVASSEEPTESTRPSVVRNAPPLRLNKPIALLPLINFSEN